MNNTAVILQYYRRFYYQGDFMKEAYRDVCGKFIDRYGIFPHKFIGNKMIYYEYDFSDCQHIKRRLFKCIFDPIKNKAVSRIQLKRWNKKVVKNLI